MSLSESTSPPEWSKSNGCSCFWLNIALIGDQSSGKTTLLNAIFGTIIGQTGLDRATKTMHVYHETGRSKHNNEHKKDFDSQQVLQQSKDMNKNQDKKFRDKTKEWQNSLWQYVYRNRRVLAEFYDIGMWDVAVSSLIPKNNRHSSAFRIFDFPGFGDKNLRDEILNQFSDNLSLFHRIFYVIDCEKGISTKESIESFMEVLKKVQKTVQYDTICRIVFVFNKYDKIELNSSARDFVERQKEYIQQELGQRMLTTRYDIYLISAQNMLVDRIIAENDSKFVENQDESQKQQLETQIRDFAPEYFNKREMRSWINEKKSIQYQINQIHQKYKLDCKRKDKDHDDESKDNDDDPSFVNKKFINYLVELRDCDLFDRIIKNHRIEKMKSMEQLDEFLASFCFLLNDRFKKKTKRINNTKNKGKNEQKEEEKGLISSPRMKR